MRAEHSDQYTSAWCGRTEQGDAAYDGIVIYDEYIQVEMVEVSQRVFFVCKVWPIPQTLVLTNRQKVTTAIAKVTTRCSDKIIGYFDYRWAPTSMLESSTRKSSRMSSDSSSAFGMLVLVCQNM